VIVANLPFGGGFAAGFAIASRSGKPKRRLNLGFPF